MNKPTEAEFIQNIAALKETGILQGGYLAEEQIEEVFPALTQEQRSLLLDYFKEHKTGGRFLLNCKMRYGKSFTTYKYSEDGSYTETITDGLEDEAERFSRGQTGVCPYYKPYDEYMSVRKQN